MQSVRSYYAQLAEHGLRPAALWIQDWSGRISSAKADRVYWNWNLDPDYYDGWEEFSKSLESDHVKLLLYVNPYLSTLPPKGNRTWQFKEAKEKGYLVLNQTSQPYLLYSVSKDFQFGTVGKSQLLWK